MKITPKQIGKHVGKVIGVAAGHAIVSLAVWVIIVFAIGLKLTYLQVWGGLVLVAMLRNWLRRG